MRENRYLGLSLGGAHEDKAKDTRVEAFNNYTQQLCISVFLVLLCVKLMVVSGCVRALNAIYSQIKNNSTIKKY